MIQNYSDEELKQLVVVYQNECARRNIEPPQPKRKRFGCKWLLEGRTPRESTMYYTSFFGFFFVDFILNMCIRYIPRTKWTLNQIYIFMYCITLSDIATEYVHPLSHFILIPITTWIAGIHDIQITKWPVINGIVSILVMMFVIPVIDAMPGDFLKPAFLYFFRRSFTLPTIYDFHPCSFMGILVFYLTLAFVLLSFNETFALSSLSLLFTTVFVSDALQLHTDKVMDNSILFGLRWVGVISSCLIIWAVISTYVYMTIGAKLYYSILVFSGLTIK